ncbi:calcium/sodium antiporter [bacterium]|nr:calcium/sodium antiporter [bacterium]
MLTAAAFLLSGLILLTLAADRFVLSAARMSRVWGMSPILIGALVVGLGTSAPELLVSSLAAARGQIDIAAGNVVGSNVANLTLVLGATALVRPIVSRVRTIRREGGLMLGATILLAVFLWDLRIGRVEGVILAVCMIGVALVMVYWARSDPDEASADDYEDLPDEPDEERILVVESDEVAGADEEPSDFKSYVSSGREIAFGLGALALTLFGADLLVRGATRMADELGITAAFVGLVIVSVGTSLPELATALSAARRGETDLVLGNVLGSNLFNSLMVMGAAGAIGPGAIGGEFRSAIVFMIGASAVAGFLALTGRRLDRWEGAVLLAGFMTFVAIAAV